MELVYIIAVFAVGFTVWWMMSRRKANVAKQTPPPRMEPGSIQPEEPTALVGPEEQEVERARMIHDRLATERAEALNAANRASMDDKEKLTRATDMVQRSHLDVALPSVREATQHWPSWTKLDTWTSPFPLSDVDGKRGSTYEEHWVQFRVEQGSLFKIEFRRLQPLISDDDKWEYANIKLLVEGEEKLAMGVSRQWQSEFDPWRFSALNSFRVGPWMAEFVELYGRLETDRQANLQYHTIKYVSNRAANVDLGD